MPDDAWGQAAAALAAYDEPHRESAQPAITFEVARALRGVLTIHQNGSGA